MAAAGAAPVAVIIHVDVADIGVIQRIAAEQGVALRVVRPFAGEPLPAPDAVAGVIILGGPQSAYEPAPHLDTERAYLADAVARDVPVLGICLGAQLLTQALGGAAVPGEHGLEAGYLEVRAAGGRGEHLAGTHFSFHSDTVVLPAGAELLAASDRYPQAWRLGSALAVQYHPELSAAGVRHLLGIEGPKLAEYGVDVEAVIRESHAREPAVRRAGDRVLTEWFVSSRNRRRTPPTH